MNKLNVKKKKVEFSSKNEKIDSHMLDHFLEDLDGHGGGHHSSKTKKKDFIKSNKLEYKVAKAKEFPSYKNLPKFSHPSLSVIHPPSTPQPVKRMHKPPRDLMFDGSHIQMTPKAHHDRYEHMAEHLTRPPIDQERLMKIREKERLRKKELEKSGL